MVTLREVRDNFQTHRSSYVEILGELQVELRSVTTEADAAKSTLAPLVAAAVARTIPDLNAPAVHIFDRIGQDLGLKQSPLTEKNQLLTRRLNAQAEMSEITHSNCSEAALTTTLTASRTATQDLQCQIEKAQEEIAQHDAVLEPFDHLNQKLKSRDLSPVGLYNLARFSRPSGGMAALWRWATDPAYRIVRPVLNQLEAANVNIWIELNLRTEAQQHMDQLQTEVQKKKAETARLDSVLTRLQECKDNQPSDREIVNILRLTVSQMMENGGYLSAVTQAMPDLLPPEALSLHTRAALMSKLAERLRETIKDTEPAATGLKDSLRDLNNAVNRHRGDVAVRNFDLSDHDRRLHAHQNVTRRRLLASQEIRQASRNNNSFRADSSSDSNNWLLWYLIFSDSSSASTGSAAPSFSGQGGASGQWNGDVPANNSYFRADMLGVTPQNAGQHGIDPNNFRIAPEVMNDLGIKALDTSTPSFNALARDSDMASSLLSANFNETSGSRAFSLPELDLGTITKAVDLGGVGMDWGNCAAPVVDSISFSSDSGSFDSCSFGD